MKAFNSKTGRHLGEIQSEAGPNFIVLNPFGQQVSIPKEQIIQDEAHAANLAKATYVDPHVRAMNQAVTSKAFLGDSYRNAKLYFIIAFLVFSGALGIILVSNLMGRSGPPFVGWALVAGIGFMFSNGLRILKYRSRMKS